ncbi:anosmin-1, partial [Dipodomys spectabilis]|uniref:anosmin-1 n=1 Tax=Dipodomys spectabilis TaxID=105255 RepID=UPI001C540B1D
CLEPCREPRDLEESQCLSYCEARFPGRAAGCAGSCAFLAWARAVKPGACPAPGPRCAGFAAACVDSCAADGDCAGARKCCANGCGRTCQAPRARLRGVPARPRQELRFREFESGRLELRWSSRFNVSLEPVVYVVQRRWNRGIHPSEDEATPWQTVTQTTEEHTQLDDIRATRWYQFRVAAVNVHGTRGFTAPSKHFRSSRAPSPPPAPSDLRVADVAWSDDGSVAVTLAWTPPFDPDLPVHHYKVTWSWTDGGTPSKRRTTTGGRLPGLVLDGLHPGLDYTVQLQPVAFWGQTRLKGPQATLRFRAPDATREPEGDLLGKLRKNGSQVQPPVQRSQPAQPLEIGTPFYQDGQLQVKVYWKKPEGSKVSKYQVEWSPEICAQNQTAGQGPWYISTQDRFLLAVPHLTPSTLYQLQVRTLTRLGEGPAATGTFRTPDLPPAPAAPRPHGKQPYPAPSDKRPPGRY